MVLTHVLDSWTRDGDRDRTAFHWAMFVGGLAAPAFLLLAGVGTALSGAAKRRAGATRAEATRALLRRGWFIFGLAFLFRLQALVLGWGAPITFLTVDILNVMGLALIAAALLWGAATSVTGRVLIACAATIAVAMAAPLVWAAAWVDVLPSPLQWYWRPAAGHGNFTLVPWAAFVFAGVAAGTALAAATDDRRQRQVQVAMLVAALATAALGYWASFQPTIYPPGHSTFWGASPAFFFLRLGVVTMLLPLMWSLRRRLPDPIAGPLATLGAASLFAYWVHVEMVYGAVAIPLQRILPLEVGLAAAAGLVYGLTRLIPWARRWVAALDQPPARVKQLVARLL